jgi:hypothetical protein
MYGQWLLIFLICSLSYNSIGAEGAVAISEAVKTLKDLQEL